MAEKIARNHQNSPGIPGGMGTGEKSKNLKKAYADFNIILEDINGAFWQRPFSLS